MLYKEPRFLSYMWRCYTRTYSSIACVKLRENRQNLCDCHRFALTSAHQPQAHESETNWPTVLNKQNGVFLFFDFAWIIASWIQAPAWQSEWRAPAPASSARLSCWRRSQRAGPPGWQRACGCRLCCPDGSLSQQARNQGGLASPPLTSKPWLDTPTFICASNCVPPTDTCGRRGDWRGCRSRSNIIGFSLPTADWLVKISGCIFSSIFNFKCLTPLVLNFDLEGEKMVKFGSLQFAELSSQTLAAACLNLTERLKWQARWMWLMLEHKSSLVYFIERFNWFAWAQFFFSLQWKKFLTLSKKPIKV